MLNIHCPFEVFGVVCQWIDGVELDEAKKLVGSDNGRKMLKLPKFKECDA